MTLTAPPYSPSFLGRQLLDCQVGTVNPRRRLRLI
jgi:hypothetical protein